MIWRLGSTRLEFPRPTLLMGVLNVTPDSFFDGGRFFTVEAAVARGRALVEEGADLLDVGGESTRPGAAPVEAAEELRRVLPVIERLAGQVSVPLSIDTMKPEVAAAALRAGASLINDVAAARGDPAMARLLADSGAGYIAMHMQGTPQTMQQQPVYEDVVAEVTGFFGRELARLQAAGVQAEQIAFDVGIGFGKTLAHNLELLRQLEKGSGWGRPLVLGVSRKSLLGAATGASSAAERLPGALVCAAWAVQHGVQIIRTHDVAETRRAVRMAEALRPPR